MEKNEKCNVHCFVITPEIKGVFSIAEIVNSCWEVKTNTNVVKFVYFIILGYFDRKMYRSLEATMRLCYNIAGNKVKILKLNKIQELFN